MRGAVAVVAAFITLFVLTEAHEQHGCGSCQRFQHKFLHSPSRWRVWNHPTVRHLVSLPSVPLGYATEQASRLWDYLDAHTRGRGLTDESGREETDGAKHDGVEGASHHGCHQHDDVIDYPHGPNGLDYPDCQYRHVSRGAPSADMAGNQPQDHNNDESTRDRFNLRHVSDVWKQWMENMNDVEWDANWPYLNHIISEMWGDNRRQSNEAQPSGQEKREDGERNAEKEREGADYYNDLIRRKQEMERKLNEDREQIRKLEENIKNERNLQRQRAEQRQREEQRQRDEQRRLETERATLRRQQEEKQRLLREKMEEEKRKENQRLERMRLEEEEREMRREIQQRQQRLKQLQDEHQMLREQRLAEDRAANHQQQHRGGKATHHGQKQHQASQSDDAHHRQAFNRQQQQQQQQQQQHRQNQHHHQQQRQNHQQHHQNHNQYERTELFTLQIPNEYTPRDIKVKTSGAKVKVLGKRVCGCDENCVVKEFERGFNLPQGVPTDSLQATFYGDGHMSIGGATNHREARVVDTEVPVVARGVFENVSNIKDRLDCLKMKSGFKMSKMDKKTGTAFVEQDLDHVRRSSMSDFDDGVTIEDVEE